MSSEPQEGSVREQLSAAEGTIVQNEEELCRQRRLLDISWNPQLQLHIAVLPQHWTTEEEDLCNQQMNFIVEQEELEPPQIKEEQEKLQPPQIKEEPEEPEPPQIKEEPEELCISQDEEGNQHEESTSTTNEETDPQNRDQRKRRDRSHVQSLDSSHTSGSPGCTLGCRLTILTHTFTRSTHDATISVRLFSRK
ncbi:general transcriptional corepressor trfA-like isoform X6 [Oryzias latipes]|uniref:general transcriptional corepressor trfA-like isoform X6 n=1 Tax=Oryzias latipes TaxID=8090 RepID=UPI000CE26E50|nr:general transcriptional corepressor trfA-like isoform X6 [Oryzias latipes]